MINKLTWAVALSLTATISLSCKGLFEYHPNQVLLEESEKNLTSKNVERITALQPGDTLRFIVTADTHQWLDETSDFVKSANQQTGVLFVAHLGDVTASNTTQEHKWFNRAMSGLKYPYVTALGEMDTPGEAAVYKAMFGAPDYAFSLAGYKFVFVNTNSSVFPASAAVPDLAWVSIQVNAGPGSKEVIVLGHTPPFDPAFKSSSQQEFARTLSASGKVKVSFYGHQHAFSESEPYHDGVEYYVTAAMRERAYLVVSLWDGGRKVDKVSF